MPEPQSDKCPKCGVDRIDADEEEFLYLHIGEYWCGSYPCHDGTFHQSTECFENCIRELTRDNAELRQRLEAAERERDALARITEPCPPGGWKLPNGDTIQFVVRMGGSVWWWDRNGIDYPTALDAIRAALKGEKT